MDQTPQRESKHDSEVPIFSVSTAEDDEDVEEYVEEEEDEDLEDDPRTPEEVSRRRMDPHSSERIHSHQGGIKSCSPSHLGP